jgi:prepilin peptidase CpaA
MDLASLFLTNWHVKLVSALLIWAAWIDGRQLRVPNWLTFPMVLSGLVFNSFAGNGIGFQESLVGMLVGLACLLPLYAVGGMGAGDVKLMAGIGAWLGGWVTFYAFLVSAVVGGIMALLMAVRSGNFNKHYANFLTILAEFQLYASRPSELSKIAAERKPRMMLLPYGIPICIGSLAYFAFHYRLV